MKISLIILLSLLLCNPSSGQDFNSLITQASDTLANRIISSGKKRVAITDFQNIDKSVTPLGTFLSDEISSELANHTDNQTKFRVLEKASFGRLFKEKDKIDFSDPSAVAMQLSAIDAADVLLFANITDFDGNYRVVFKMLDTKNGDALSTYKMNFPKTPSLEKLYKPAVYKEVQAVQPIQNASSTNVTDQPLNGGPPGDYCFRNVDRTGYRASVSITRSGNSNVLKTISVNYGESNCMLELPPGVYTVTVSWSDRWLNSIPSSTHEVRVKSGTSGNLDIGH